MNSNHATPEDNPLAAMSKAGTVVHRLGKGGCHRCTVAEVEDLKSRLEAGARPICLPSKEKPRLA